MAYSVPTPALYASWWSGLSEAGTTSNLPSKHVSLKKGRNDLFCRGNSKRFTESRRTKEGGVLFLFLPVKSHLNFILRASTSFITLPIEIILTHNSPKYSEKNLAQEKSEGFFPFKHEILSFEKCLNY